MKTLGRVAYEAFEEFWKEAGSPGQQGWAFTDQVVKDAWDATAQEVIQEYERRRDDEKQEGKTI